ncbi:hypothetical protein H257_12950 [Aphanomyces astaci]|uniref:Uncharacterized protein n=1 Tax=Aphanomyces astaci TaxID=112090 RepID=W4FXV9_APHAT|nr:hypothetical protein H257_12950 [Aphanomyces astaci]ETV71806.1 hypothetical protein H257_12950 [Aphanomyces astaci]|eukprot:XP_009838655.1 hypothetical protein H257_12950 [Aphanomyces astaci]
MESAKAVRGSNFTTDEDCQLARSWINISQDASKDWIGAKVVGKSEHAQPRYLVYSYARYATDVKVQPATRPIGCFGEQKHYFSGKHKLYGLKIEAVAPTGSDFRRDELQYERAADMATLSCAQLDVQEFGQCLGFLGEIYGRVIEMKQSDARKLPYWVTASA